MALFSIPVALFTKMVLFKELFQDGGLEPPAPVQYIVTVPGAEGAVNVNVFVVAEVNLEQWTTSPFEIFIPVLVPIPSVPEFTATSIPPAENVPELPDTENE